MPNQPRHMSLIESVINVAIGFWVSVLATQLILPFFNYHPSLGQNLQISGIFTGISVVRSYVVRRLFNALR